MGPARKDAELLKGLPKVKVQATWVPWTYDRLAYWTGYGAGIESPGWYHHLWTCRDGVTIRWMTRVARLLRDEDVDCSSAHVIEGVRVVREGRYVLKRGEPACDGILGNVKDPPGRKAREEPPLFLDRKGSVEHGERSRLDDGVQDADDLRGIVGVRLPYREFHGTQTT
jgi:hypothetical protein